MVLGGLRGRYDGVDECTTDRRTLRKSDTNDEPMYDRVFDTGFLGGFTPALSQRLKTTPWTDYRSALSFDLIMYVRVSGSQDLSRVRPLIALLESTL